MKEIIEPTHKENSSVVCSGQLSSEFPQGIFNIQLESVRKSVTTYRDRKKTGDRLLGIFLRQKKENPPSK